MESTEYYIQKGKKDSLMNNSIELEYAVLL